MLGPAIDADVGAFQAAFGGETVPRVLATPRRLNHRAVYGDQLYRDAVLGFANANRVETDLDMGGNDLTGAGRIEARTLALESDLTVCGGLAVPGDLVVGRAMQVSGPAEVTRPAPLWRPKQAAGRRAPPPAAPTRRISYRAAYAPAAAPSGK